MAQQQQPIDPRLHGQYAPGPYQHVDALRHAHGHLQQQHPHTSPPQPYYNLPPLNHLNHPGLPPPLPTSHTHLSPHAQQQSPQHVDPALQGDEQDSGGEDSGSEHASPVDGQPGSGKQPEKRPRACDSCRGLKVKCIIDPSSGEPCKRCAKAGRQCIVTPPTRKRQKKADSRVAELERKIDALTATLAAREGVAQYENNGYVDVKRQPESTSPYTQSSPQQYQADQRLLGNHDLTSPPTMTRGSRPNDGPDKRRRTDPIDKVKLASIHDGHTIQITPAANEPGDRNTSIYNQQKPPIFDHSDIDRKISTIIDSATAENIFDQYVNHGSHRFPAVPFAPGTKAKTIRAEKPILFMAILSSTCYGTGVSEDTQVALEREMREIFACSMWKQGEKSLELIQALHVATLWYRPPANFEQHMFYQMVHMSAIMAIDIGIGKRQSPWKRKWFGQEPPFRRVLPNPESAEARRAWIVCYFLCISITMVLRRPILVRFNDYMRECLEYLETAEDALPSDKILCQHVRIAHISEQIAVQFAMDDPAVNLSISDGKVSYGIHHFEQALADVRASKVTDHALQLAEHVTNLYLHEIALHSQNNVEDFKAPFTEESFKTAASDHVLGPQHVDALTACQKSCRDILETFLSYEFDIIYALPVIFSVRVIYAVVVIIKLYIAATGPGEIGAIIKRDELHIEQYLERLQQLFQTIMDKDRLSPHSKFLWVIQRLVERYQGIKGRTSKSTGINTPLLTCGDFKGPPKPAQAADQAPGLQMLSQVATSNNEEQNGDSRNQLPVSQQAQPQQGHQGWYPPQQQQQQHMDNLPMDPAAYAYQGGPGLPGYDGFDYGIGSLGMGMDGAISGLFMADGLWNFNDAQAQGQQHLFPEGYTCRPLRKSDYHSGFLDVLRVLTTVGDISEEAWDERYEWMSKRNDEYFLLVIVDTARETLEGKGGIVGTGCLVVERKFIHSLGLVGHIEDIAVAKDQQGKKLGLRIIQALDHVAEQVGCYKTILDCSEANEGFYVKCGFRRAGLEMAHYYEPKSSHA
ncbi:Nucleolar GTP-binding protein 1 [Venturia inaequalis]|nr:Nucleolar GTP-binding protein 1 [Venturia inaequalis]